MSGLGTHLWIVLIAVLCTSLGSVPTAWGAEVESASPSEESRPQFELRPYLEYSIGLSIVRNQNLSGGDPPNPNFSGRIETEEGVNVGLAVGVRILELFRTEIAVGYQNNVVEKQAVRPGQKNADGDLSLFTAIVNAYYDYDLADHGVPLIPFVGVGVGFGEIKLDADTQGGVLQVGDDDAVFTWNVMAGVTYPFTETTHFTIGYRYLATDDVRFKARVAGSGVRWIDSEYDSHDVRAGMRFNF